MLRWNSKAGQYTENGRFVKRSRVLTLLDAEIERGKTKLKNHAQRMIRQEITVGDWQRSFTQDLKNLYLQMGLFGSGGKNMVSPELRSFVQYNLGEIPFRIHKLGKQLQAGEITEAQLMARISNYGEQSRIGFYWAEKQAQLKSGKNQAKRLLTPGFVHCAECISYATDWVNIDLVTAIGHRCSCRGRCKCRIFYRAYR